MTNPTPLRFLPAYPYQETGIATLASRPCFWLADEMGLGKTMQVVRASERTPYQRTLVICPAIVRPTWVEEIRKWTLLDPPTIREIKSGRQATGVETPGPGWWIVSYAYARRHWRRFVGWVDRVVFDEVHCLRNLQTKQTKELLGNAGLAHAEGVKSIWALTGTPTPNHPGELYPVLAILGGLPDDAITYADFCGRYCILDDQQRPIELKTGAGLEKLKRSVRSVMLRRTKNDVGLELPPVTRSIIWTPGIDPTVEEIAESALSRFAPDPEGLKAQLAQEREAALEAIEEMRFDILSAGISTLRVWIALRKRKVLQRLIQMEMGDQRLYSRLVVFGLHKDLLWWLAPRCPAQAEVIAGGVSPAQREATIDRWRAGATRILLGQIMACGTGVTWTEANQIILAEPWWNMDINDQAIARLHRIGQLRPLTVRFLMLSDEPFEEALIRLLARKSAMNAQLWGGDK